MPYEIKELQLGELLDHAIALLRNEFKQVTLILVCILMPLLIALQFVSTLLLPVSYGDPFAAFSGEPVPVLPIELFLVVYPMMLVVFLLVVPFTKAAVIHAIALRYQGRAVTLGGSFMYALRVLLPVIGATFVFGLATGFGYMCFCIPGVLLNLIWYLYLPVLVLERSSVFKAFGRSFRLMQGSMMKAFVLLLIIFVCKMVLQFGIAMIFGTTDRLGVRLAVDIFSGAASSFVVAFDAILATVFYFSERCRVEQLDLQLRAQAAPVQSEGGERTL